MKLQGPLGGSSRGPKELEMAKNDQKFDIFDTFFSFFFINVNEVPNNLLKTLSSNAGVLHIDKSEGLGPLRALLKGSKDPKWQRLSKSGQNLDYIYLCKSCQSRLPHLHTVNEIIIPFIQSFIHLLIHSFILSFIQYFID